MRAVESLDSASVRIGPSSLVIGIRRVKRWRLSSMERELCTVVMITASTQIFSITTIFVIVNVMCHLLDTLKARHGHPLMTGTAIKLIDIFNIDIIGNSFESAAHA